MTRSIIKYALSNVTGEPVYINVASNGLSCDCSCAKCSEKMVAVQGKSENHREWHFRHHIDSDCLGGQETAIHKLAKQIIVDNSKILIPGETLLYSAPKQEVKFGEIIPDVSVNSNIGEIHFEIVVTHPVDSVKENFYRGGNHKSIEIDLKNISHDIEPKELEGLVLYSVENKRKIFWENKNLIVQDKKTENKPLIWVFAIGSAFITFICVRYILAKKKRS